MDIGNITDLEKLKALAYDQIAAKEQAESTLRSINQRIVEVSQIVNQTTLSSPNDLGAEAPENANEPIAGEVVEQPAE